VSGFGEFAFGLSPFGGPSFAPESPGVTQTIPAYVYAEYLPENDSYNPGDDTILNFVAAYNEIAQEYIDWLNAIGLPVYTGYLISGLLLDWVGNNVYGVERPYITISGQRFAGPYNTWLFNSIPYNFTGFIGPVNSYPATDDVYKRTITWNFFKGDGSTFNVRWLKRRVMRFLFGAAGINYNVDQTYRVSVTFGPDHEVTIRIVDGETTVVKSSAFNAFTFNSVLFNGYATAFEPLPPIPMAMTLKAGIDQGFLVLPFWLNVVVLP
jgi:hypothetical protein